MSTWTDEHLADLLATTFAAHEDDADPVVAHRIALTTPPAPRRVWPVLAAVAVAIVVVVVVVVGVQAMRPEVAPSPTRPAPAPGAEPHRSIARDEVNRLMSTVPVPPGAELLPDRHLRSGAQIGFVDPSLTRTEEWTVAMPYGAVADWYAAHAPEEAASERPLWWTEPGTAAYTEPAVVVGYRREGPDRTRIRIAVTIAARDDRTAATFVPDDVTSVEITRTDITGPVGPPSSVTVTDRERIAAIVDAFNRLQGAPGRAEGTACGSPVGDAHVYSATFHWPGHALSVDPGAPLCGEGRSLVLDGRELRPTLEDSDAFNTALAAGF